MIRIYNLEYFGWTLFSLGLREKVEVLPDLLARQSMDNLFSSEKPGSLGQVRDKWLCRGFCAQKNERRCSTLILFLFNN